MENIKNINLKLKLCRYRDTEIGNYCGVAYYAIKDVKTKEVGVINISGETIYDFDEIHSHYFVKDVYLFMPVSSTQHDVFNMVKHKKIFTNVEIVSTFDHYVILKSPETRLCGLMDTDWPAFSDFKYDEIKQFSNKSNDNLFIATLEGKNGLLATSKIPNNLKFIIEEILPLEKGELKYNPKANLLFRQSDEQVRAYTLGGVHKIEELFVADNLEWSDETSKNPLSKAGVGKNDFE